ncbi:MAG: PIN domain-containing protein [Bacillota bacterium]|nr:PIN domain-containing protein [Bacillota bacterium]
MKTDCFLDTNLLVYAYDRSEPDKQTKAQQLLNYLAERGLGSVSAQVLSEFYVAVTRKIAAPLSSAEAAERLRNHFQTWTVLEVTGPIVLEAARGVTEHQFPFWDAQIWATAKLNQIPLVLSEDFRDGAFVEGVRFLNPFREGFELGQQLDRDPCRPR